MYPTLSHQHTLSLLSPLNFLQLANVKNRTTAGMTGGT